MNESLRAGEQSEGRRRVRSTASPRTRVRTLYFSVAAAWGFLTGVGAILCCAAAAGQDLHLNSGGGLVLGSGLAAAVVGGLLAAHAYQRETRR
ncbi:MAG TPA: hypothetical protein VJS92_12225 [Candidatus Polarisedimenticolaceae bacterium]|nr:hypothetical protein [Candidatus Polarisedimenticolaceae bacterium]